jgi:hypothetical protein
LSRIEINFQEARFEEEKRGGGLNLCSRMILLVVFLDLKLQRLKKKKTLLNLKECDHLENIH